jgi:hypothetical protein
VLIDGAEADLDLSVNLMTNSLFKNAGDMWQALSDIENLRATDLDMSSFEGVKGGNIFSYTKTIPGGWSEYYTNLQPSENPTIYNSI